MTERYGHFNQLVEVSIQMLEQRISLGEFEETLNRIIAIIRTGFTEFNKIDAPLNLKGETARELLMVQQGLTLFERGVQEMRRYIDTRERQHLVEGLRMAQKANELLNEIVRRYDEFPPDRPPSG